MATPRVGVEGAAGLSVPPGGVGGGGDAFLGDLFQAHCAREGEVRLPIARGAVTLAFERMRFPVIAKRLREARVGEGVAESGEGGEGAAREVVLGALQLAERLLRTPVPVGEAVGGGRGSGLELASDSAASGGGGGEGRGEGGEEGERKLSFVVEVVKLAESGETATIRCAALRCLALVLASPSGRALAAADARGELREDGSVGAEGVGAEKRGGEAGGSGGKVLLGVVGRVAREDADVKVRIAALDALVELGRTAEGQLAMAKIDLGSKLASHASSALSRPFVLRRLFAVVKSVAQAPSRSGTVRLLESGAGEAAGKAWEEAARALGGDKKLTVRRQVAWCETAEEAGKVFGAIGAVEGGLDVLETRAQVLSRGNSLLQALSNLSSSSSSSSPSSPSPSSPSPSSPSSPSSLSMASLRCQSAIYLSLSLTLVSDTAKRCILSPTSSTSVLDHATHALTRALRAVKEAAEGAREEGWVATHAARTLAVAASYQPNRDHLLATSTHQVLAQLEVAADAVGHKTLCRAAAAARKAIEWKP